MIACWLGPREWHIVNIRIRRLHGWPSRDKAGLIRYKNANRMEGELQDSIACTHCQEGACYTLFSPEQRADAPPPGERSHSLGLLAASTIIDQGADSGMT